MRLSLELRQEARLDLFESLAYYESQRTALGEDFVDAVDEFLGRLQEMPMRYPLVFGDVRRGKLQRFPYAVYYRISTTQIEVLGCLHGSRDPQIIRGRARHE